MSLLLVVIFDVDTFSSLYPFSIPNSSEMSVFVTPPPGSQHAKLTSILKLVNLTRMKKGGKNVVLGILFLILFVR